MISPLDAVFDALARQAYLAAFSYHGDLDLAPEQYISHLLSVATKHLGQSLSQFTAPAFVARLHTVDLYLSVACTRPSELAWRRFTLLYQAFIGKVSRAASSSDDGARAVADRITGDLFLPDGSGGSRIGSYQGLSSLAFWLARLSTTRRLKSKIGILDWNSLRICMTSLIPPNIEPLNPSSAHAGTHHWCWTH